MTTPEGAALLTEMRAFRHEVDGRLDRMSEQIAELKVAEAERRGQERATNPGVPPVATESAISAALARWLDRWTPPLVIALVVALAVLAGTASVGDLRQLLPSTPPAQQYLPDVRDDEPEAAASISPDTGPGMPRPMP